MSAGKNNASHHVRGDETVFVDSSTGLRDVAVDTAQPKLVRVLRYAPLVLMVCLALLATAVGVWYQRTHVSVTVPQSESGVQSDATASEPSLPTICSRRVPQPTPGPWDTSDTSQAEAAFASGTKGAGAWIEGRDEFSFWSDAVNANISQAVGRVHVDAAQMQAWSNYISGIAHTAREDGAQFLVMIAPAKWDVYRDKLPEWTDAVEGPTSRERLMAAYPDLPWVDVRDALIDRRATDPQTPLYSRSNSHWSPYGASVAWNRTLQCLSALNGKWADLTGLDVSSVAWEESPDEFAAFGATASSSRDWTVPIYARDLGTVEVSYLQRDASATLKASDRLDFADLPAVTTNPEAPGNTLLVARDSMGNAMSTGMMASFHQTIQVRNGFDVDEPADLSALIDLYRPDVVILEFAERYLVQTPGKAT